MSHETYTRLWAQAQELVDEAARTDVDQQSAKPLKDKRLAHRIVGDLFIKYTKAINWLDQCYDQVVQPQKRQLLRRLLDLSLGRYLELKHELVNLDISEFNYFDDVLTEQRILPSEAQVNIPNYYRRERAEEIAQRKKNMDIILKKLGFYEEEYTGIEMTEYEAIRLIQIHERARQGRLRSQFMKEIRLLKEKVKGEPLSKERRDEIKRKAALRIQTLWRGHRTRRRVRKRVIEEMLLIGMLPPMQNETTERQRAQQVKEMRWVLQDQYQQDLNEAIVANKQLLKRTKGAQMAEDIKDEMRQWIMAYKGQTGKFPELPSEEAGGSALIFSRQGADSEVSKSTAPSSKEGKGKKEKGKKGGKDKEDAKKKKADDEEDPGFKMGVSSFLTDLMVASAEYDDVWRNRDESSNPQQAYYPEIIISQNTSQVESEIRKVIDEELRAELELLQAALDRDRAKKGKKGKKGSKKKKGRRTGKKGKKKKEKDLTPDRTLESLFEELITNGIIKKYPETPLSSFIGDRSYSSSELRLNGKDPLPSLGDIRQVILEYCILPLGSKLIHQLSPVVRSVLIAGPHGSGKDMLVHTICTEAGAVLFDLTAANIVGKYPGKSGLIMLVHLVSKVSRLLQPSVIYMDGAEKPFLKKVPKTDKTDPKRLKKDLPKLVKSIGPDDQKTLAQTYHKMVLMVRPDYASLQLLWAQLLFQYSGVNRRFDTGALTRLSDGYTVGTIVNVVKEVMTCKRILQLRIQPLTLAEIINVLARYEPVYKEEEEQFMAWFSKTPLGRRKTRALELEQEQQQLNNETVNKKNK